MRVRAGGEEQLVWPYTTDRFPARPQDPLNLIFIGRSDPRNLRAALLGLDADRPELRGLSLFACRWKDAIGGHQAAYSEAEGWTGSVVQLECGDYQPLRVHLRIFRVGGWSVANAHLDTIVPGTADHQVISWELARSLVVYDLHRSGLLEAAAPSHETGRLHPPEFRAVPRQLLASLPGPLRAVLVETGSITPDGRLLTRGTASVLNVARTAPPVPDAASQEVRIECRRVIPKPFCNAGGEHVLIEGRLTLRQRVQLGADGGLRTTVRAGGELDVTPVDAATGQAVGPSSRAEVEERHAALLGDRDAAVSMWQLRRMVAGPMLGQSATLDMRVGPRGRVYYAPTERYGP